MLSVRVPINRLAAAIMSIDLQFRSLWVSMIPTLNHTIVGAQREF
jgi:hypothetical protein